MRKLRSQTIQPDFQLVDSGDNPDCLEPKSRITDFAFTPLMFLQSICIEKGLFLWNPIIPFCSHFQSDGTIPMTCEAKPSWWCPVRCKFRNWFHLNLESDLFGQNGNSDSSNSRTWTASLNSYFYRRKFDLYESVRIENDGFESENHCTNLQRLYLLWWTQIGIHKFWITWNSSLYILWVKDEGIPRAEELLRWGDKM